MSPTFIGTIALALVMMQATAANLPRPERVVAPATPEQMLLVREGVAAYDQQNYRAAVEKYKDVLAANPWEIHALQELALTYFAMGNYEDAIRTAKLGSQCKSEALPQFYMLIANSLDEQGRGKEAIETYKSAISLSPDAALLHYNLAVSLRRAGMLAQSKSEAERAVHYDPLHASSHLLLGSIYNELGYRIPAILAYSRFLDLEPASARSQQILPVLSHLVTLGVTQSPDNKHINITVAAPTKNLVDEGDFVPAEMMISLMAAASAMGEKKHPTSPYDRLVSVYVGLGESLENSQPRGGFAAKYYVPYFSSLVKAGYTEAFVAHAWRAGQLEGASNWESANQTKLEEFSNWSNSYSWEQKR